MQIDHDIILRAKEKLGDENAIIIARELGISDFDQQNLRSCCPFHNENTPSFIFNKKTFSFHCFGACSRNYDIIDVFIHGGMTYLQACKKLFDLAGIQYGFGELGVRTKHQYRYPKEVACTDKSTIYDYYSKRKISESTIDYTDVRQDGKGNAVFNYYDSNDVLTMVKYRPARKLGSGDRKNWCQENADTSNLLFNMNRINVGAPLLITEGESDCLSAIEAGFTNAVSVPFGSGNYRWIEENWDWLEQFDSIIICSDNDEAGMKMQKEVVYRLGSWRTKVVELPQICVTKSGKEIPVNDLNEALYWFGAETVANLIVNAKDSPVTSVKDLSDVQDVDLDAIDGVQTGIQRLDKEIMKLFYGTLTIVSGVPGAGKTSFLYQIICQALDQNKNCWLYSGELPEQMTKNWLNYIFAGGRNITSHETADGDMYYKVKTSSKRAIDDHYRGRWYIYKDDCDNDLDVLIQSMTDVVRKFGVKLLMLDNMMTIDTEDTENELRVQTNTIKRLISFSRQYNVATILVCHPRKLVNTSTVGIYDIAGTSNIANLAHRTIGLRRVLEFERDHIDKLPAYKRDLLKHDVIVSIIKDRMRGRSNIELGIYYDSPTRRFFTSLRDLDHRYAWDTAAHDGPLPFPPKQLEDEEGEVFGKIG